MFTPIPKWDITDYEILQATAGSGCATIPTWWPAVPGMTEGSEANRTGVLSTLRIRADILAAAMTASAPASTGRYSKRSKAIKRKSAGGIIRVML